MSQKTDSVLCRFAISKPKRLNGEFVTGDLSGFARKQRSTPTVSPKQNVIPNNAAKNYISYKAVPSPIASLGDQPDALLRFDFRDCARTKRKSEVKRTAFS